MMKLTLTAQAMTWCRLLRVEALEVARQRVADLVLTDINIPAWMASR